MNILKKIKNFYETEDYNDFSPFEYNFFTSITFFLVCCFPLTAYLLLKDTRLTIHTVSLAYISFVLGKTLELRRISGQWITVLKIILTSLLLSLLIFFAVPKHARYNLQDNLDFWPIAFSIVFIISSAKIYYGKLTIKLGEGTTLLHSLALLYFLVEFHFKEGLPIGFILLILPFVGYSVFHAFSYRELQRKHRLYLSIWSSLVMMIFAMIYLFNVYRMKRIENLISGGFIIDAINVGFECFLLGASGVYIMQNVSMLLDYSTKGKQSQQDYDEQVARNNELHISRYSSEQVERKEAVFVLILLIGLYTTNFFTESVEPTVAIWFSFVIVPIAVTMFIQIMNKVTRSK